MPASAETTEPLLDALADFGNGAGAGTRFASRAECVARAHQIADQADPGRLLEMVETLAESHDRAWRSALWILAEMGARAGNVGPRLLDILTAALAAHAPDCPLVEHPRIVSECLAARSKRWATVDLDLAGLCHAASRIVDAEIRERTMRSLLPVASPTWLWCTWVMSRGLPADAVGSFVSAAQTAIEADLLANIDGVQPSAARQSERRRIARISDREERRAALRRFERNTRREPPGAGEARLTSMIDGLVMAGELALPILERALLRTVATPARGPGTSLVSDHLCRAVVGIAGQDALPLLLAAEQRRQAYAFGGACIRYLAALALASGQTDEALGGLLLGQDTHDRTVDVLAGAGATALPFLRRALEGPDEARALSALDVVLRLGPAADELGPAIRRLTKATDGVVAGKAVEALRVLAAGAKKGGKEGGADRVSLVVHPILLERLDPCGGLQQ